MSKVKLRCFVSFVPCSLFCLELIGKSCMYFCIYLFKSYYYCKSRNRLIEEILQILQSCKFSALWSTTNKCCIYIFMYIAKHDQNLTAQNFHGLLFGTSLGRWERTKGMELYILMYINFQKGHEVSLNVEGTKC